MPNHRTLCSALFLTTILSAFSAQAGQISFSNSWALGKYFSRLQNVNSASDDLDSFRSIFLNKFDSNLGTLNSVTLELSGSVNSSAQGIFRDTQSGGGGGIDTSGLQRLNFASYFSGAGFSQAGTGFIRTDSCYYSNPAPSATFAQCQTNLSSQSQNVGLNSISLTSPIDLNAYTGSGGFSTTVGLLGGLFSNENDNDSGFVHFREAQINGSGILKVIYDYSALPPASVSEPFSFGLLSMALAGLGIAKRRRRKLYGA